MPASPCVQARGERGLVLAARRVAEPLELDERPGERGDAEHVGRAGLVPIGALLPVDVVDAAPTRRRRRRPGGRGAASSQSRPADERAGAERRVRLVAREREVVDAGCREVDAAVRQQLRGVHREARAVRVREPGERRDREHLARDVRGAGHRQERGGTGRRARRRAPRASRRSWVRPTTTRRSRHGSRFAWCSMSSTTVSPGTAEASRFSASVVLRVNTTRSSSRAPTWRATVARASSTSAVESPATGSRCRGARSRSRAARGRRAPRPRRGPGRMPRRRGSRAAPCRRRARAPRGRRRRARRAGAAGAARPRHPANASTATPARACASCAGRWRSRVLLGSVGVEPTTAGGGLNHRVSHGVTPRHIRSRSDPVRRRHDAVDDDGRDSAVGDVPAPPNPVQSMSPAWTGRRLRRRPAPPARRARA